jgi:hypothetical protein
MFGRMNLTSYPGGGDTCLDQVDGAIPDVWTFPSTQSNRIGMPAPTPHPHPELKTKEVLSV